MPYLRLDGVSLHFPLYGVGRRTLKRELIRVATGGVLCRDRDEVPCVRALDRIDLEIPDGMRLGLVGHNGAGKSTFLRLVSGIYEPSSGQIAVEGRVTSILDVMIGIDEESTGYENIFLRGLLQGLAPKEIGRRRGEIADFTELGDFLAMPIRTYSTGMKVRLAFGIATSIVPEILVIDEVFGTGDAPFLAKAEQRMRAVISSSNIVIFTSHHLPLIEEVCTHVLWLDGGRLGFFGPVEEGIERYRKASHP